MITFKALRFLKLVSDEINKSHRRRRRKIEYLFEQFWGLDQTGSQFRLDGRDGWVVMGGSFT